MKQLTDAAARAHIDPARVLGEYAWLGAAIDADAAAGRFIAWGPSTVIDENTGEAVLPPALFAALHARAGIQAVWPVGNAGLLHVYGYLLSSAPTPYGLKRARWLDGELARAYGLPGDAFVPWARPDSLLARVSEAASALLRRGAVRRADVEGTETAFAVGRVPDAGPSALVYAVNDLLVTTFPVASPDAVLSEWDAEPPRLRWNAVG